MCCGGFLDKYVCSCPVTWILCFVVAWVSFCSGCVGLGDVCGVDGLCVVKIDTSIDTEM